VAGAPKAAAIVLAAGVSKRMGADKMLLAVGGRSLVRRAVEAASAAGPPFVVVGDRCTAVERELAGVPCRFVVNPERDGPSSGSLHRGLRELPPDVGAAIVVLGDMPFVTAAMVGALIEHATADPAPLVVSRYAGVYAPPLLFRRSLFDELLAWNGEGCGKQVVMRHEREAAFIDWPAERLADIDTAGDLWVAEQRA